MAISKYALSMLKTNNLRVNETQADHDITQLSISNNKLFLVNKITKK